MNSVGHYVAVSSAADHGAHRWPSLAARVDQRYFPVGHSRLHGERTKSVLACGADVDRIAGVLAAGGIS